MTMRGFVLIVALALLVIPSQAAAQRSYGDGFGVGGVLLPSGSPILLGATRVGDSVGVEFSVAVRVSDDGDHNETDLAAGIGIKKFVTDRKQFQPFYGGRFGFHHVARDEGHGSSDDTRFGVTGFLGGEYFFIRDLSIQGEIGFDLFFGSIELGTSTRLAALYYL